MNNIDYIVLLTYLIVVTVAALWIGRKQTSTQSYFLADRNLPWWMIMFSVVATETSVLTFLSVPGVAYQTDLGFLQLAIGYILGRWIVAKVFLPHYFEQGIESTYEFILNRWGAPVQRFASFVFIVTRILADGVRLFVSAIPLSLITGWSYPTSIFVIGLFTLIYTLVGGIRSVIWADSLQFCIYLIGGLFSIWILNSLIDGGWKFIFQTADQMGKLQFLHISLEGGFTGILQNRYHFFTAVIGGMFLSMASHGTDHLMVQRIMATRNISSGQKALIGSGILVFIQFSLFLLIGIALWVLFNGKEMKPDDVFSTFILYNLPAGVSGLIVAGIFSAAMSSLSSSINSLASSTMTDWIKSKYPDKYTLWVSRLLSVFWALILIGGAVLLSLFLSRDDPFVHKGLAIASFSYGGLLGFFVLGRIKKQIAPRSVIIGFFVSLLVMIAVISFTQIAWPWYTIIGVGTMIPSSILTERLLKIWSTQ